MSFDLLSILLKRLAPGEKPTLAAFESFVTDALENRDNYFHFDPDTGNIKFDSSTTALYSGSTGGDGGVYNGNIAKDLGVRTGGDAA